MDLAAVLEALQSASGFELFRLRAALDIALDDPQLNLRIRQQLHAGQMVAYFNAGQNRQCSGQIIELRKKEALIRHLESGEHWGVPYIAINLSGVDVRVHDKVARGLSRQEVAMGDRVGFLDREQRERWGQVVRLNEKTVTLDVDGQKWRVAYVFLHRMLDAVPADFMAAQIISR